MTVYSNIITIHGADAAHVIFRAVHGWLKGQLGHHIEYRDIFRTETLEGKKRSGASVRSKTYLATRSEPKLYAWRLRHRDALISTRSWVVEIGVREDDGHATATVVVTVEDENTLVDVTVRPSRPKFVQYLVDAIHKQRDLWFSPETPPRDVMWIDCDDHELIALHEEIHRSTRAYPIVLVSPAPNGEFLINIERLSRELVGLAEIVAIGENCNTYRLEEVLKRRFSAFGGAINVIAPTLQHDQIVRTRLLLSDQLLDLAEADREQFILANVTAFTNRLYRRRLITADKVLREASRQNTAMQLSKLKESISSDAESDRTIELLEELLTEAENERKDLDRRLAEEQEQREQQDLYSMELEEKLQERDDKIRSLQYQLNLRSVESVDRADSDGENAISEDSSATEILFGADDPEPEACLTAIQAAYPKRVQVLPSALKSAAKSRGFKHGRRLLNLLYRLSTEYLDLYLDGGDNAARHVLGSSYAARESDSTIAKSQYKKSRTFDVDGKPTLMEQHLKIGVADNALETIRAHFAVDLTRQMIVIGYCGPHLPVSGA